MSEHIKYFKVTETGIYGFFESYRFLSNYHISPVKFEGCMYPSSEAAYMAAKTLDLDLRKKFEQLTPTESKKLGKIIELRPDWETVKLSVMQKIVLDKFYRNRDINKLLLATGNKYLEETNHWGDNYWGKDYRADIGKNHLGLTLMQVRDILT